MNNFNYVNEHTFYAMSSERFKLLPNCFGFIKNRNEIVFYPPIQKEFIKYEYKNIKLRYLTEEDYQNFLSLDVKHSKTKYKGIISYFSEEFFNLKGTKYQEFRTVINKYKKLNVEVLEDFKKIEDIYELISRWKAIKAEKTIHFLDHTGLDKNFFKNYFEKFKRDLFSRFFYIDNKLVGYSIISLLKDKNKEECFKEITRKFDYDYKQICLYIDYITFFDLYKKLNKPYYLNRSATTDKNIILYKNKFPIYKIIPVYFIKIINNISQENSLL